MLKPIGSSFGAVLAKAAPQCEALDCGAELDDVNVEAWELSGKFLCEDCAESFFEEAAQ
jgi:hypothetical protein